jgi:hypothetical protein
MQFALALINKELQFITSIPKSLDFCQAILPSNIYICLALNDCT